MPVNIELLPPWHRVTPEQEARTRAYVKLGNYAPERFHQICRLRMAAMDEYPQAVRLLIHEYGIIARKLYLQGTPVHRIEADILALRRKRDLDEAIFTLEL